jgi:hypothetical protein
LKSWINLLIHRRHRSLAGRNLKALNLGWDSISGGSVGSKLPLHTMLKHNSRSFKDKGNTYQGLDKRRWHSRNIILSAICEHKQVRLHSARARRRSLKIALLRRLRSPPLIEERVAAAREGDVSDGVRVIEAIEAIALSTSRHGQGAAATARPASALDVPVGRNRGESNAGVPGPRVVRAAGCGVDAYAGSVCGAAVVAAGVETDVEGGGSRCKGEDDGGVLHLGWFFRRRSDERTVAELVWKTGGERDR